ncbi:hypothetical protein ACKKBG_A25610 [Auxenochlorella protothecoides x Auxenochlorella symbiontica]
MSAPRLRRHNVLVLAVVALGLCSVALPFRSHLGEAAAKISGAGPFLHAEEEALVGDACLQSFPWMDSALNKFFEKARSSARESNLTASEGLQALHKIRWGKYPPGHDEVSLLYNASTARVEMEIVKTFKPNAAHKRPCILDVLRDAVQRHNAALHALLGGRELRLVIETEDFPMTSQGKRLPAFAMCWEQHSIDIPIPDFTFKCYPEAKYTNTTWAAMAALIDHRSQMVGWDRRTNAIFQRSNWGVGPRRSLLPALVQLRKEGRDEAELGARLDVEDTEFVASNAARFEWVDTWCNSKYMLHTAGFSYSAALKYRLACGALVFKVPSKWVEFYEPGLEAGVHYVELPPYEHEGGDAKRYVQEAAPLIKQAVVDTLGGTKVPEIAANGQAWALHNLSEEGLSCYWYAAIKRYAEIYFDPRGEEAEKAEVAAQDDA